MNITFQDFSPRGAKSQAGGAAETVEHMGLRSMQERASQLAGTFLIEGSPGRGTRLYVQVPMRAVKQ